MKQQHRKQRQRYPTDVTDAQWAVVEAAMPPAVCGRTGTPERYPRREMWNAIFYHAENGGSWRALPHDFPPWPAVWQQYRRWRDNGTLAAVHSALREQVRERAGREVTPSAAIVDSQSVRVAEKRGRRGAMTRARRSRGASGTSSSTRWG
jgi:putative transposase